MAYSIDETPSRLGKSLLSPCAPLHSSITPPLHHSIQFVPFRDTQRHIADQLCSQDNSLRPFAGRFRSLTVSIFSIDNHSCSFAGRNEPYQQCFCFTDDPLCPRSVRQRLSIDSKSSAADHSRPSYHQTCPHDDWPLR